MPNYDLLARQIRELAREEPWYVPFLSNVSALLWDALPDLNWAGFYLMRGGRLVLGPFQGKVACIHIAVGKGVCGTAVAEDRVQRVPDVHRFPGHIACDSASNSEIVLPIHQNGQVIGVLDIDSPLLDRFSPEDEAGLIKVVGEIEEEAFMGDTSITEVVLPERLEVIGDRAFMDCVNLQAIHIPASVWSIGQDALPPQALVICEPYSTAENYAIEHGLQYEYEKHYAIGDIWVSEEGEAFIQVTTGDACALRVEILDSDQETVLLTGTAPCEERVNGGIVSVFFDELPEYFALRAVLEDGEGSALCAPVLWLERMDPYREFENKQPGDFSGGRVLDYGENGFAVFRDDVREVAGTESGGLYTVQSEEEIYDWDRLYIPSLNAVLIAQNVTDNGDGTYTLSAYGGDEIGLESFFQYVNYHATLDGTSGAAGTEYADSVQSPRGTGEVKRFKKTLTVGSVTAQANMGLTITCNLRYDAALFGDWHMECDLYTDADASLSLTATQEYSFEREIPLFVGTVPTDIPGLLVTMDLSLPMELYARAEASASAQINSRVGFRYNSDSGYETLREGDAGWDLSAKAELGAKVGPKVSLGLSFLRLVTASVSGSVGCEFQAVAEKSLSSHD